MPERPRFHDAYRVFALLAIGWAVFFAPPASARLSETMHSFAIRYVKAIHHPTGCVAMLEYNGATLLGAFITDPLCLPRGVAARPIPAFVHDFHVPASKREILINR